MLSITIQERVHARTMKRITPEQVQKLDRGMAVETYRGEFLDISSISNIRKTFGNLADLKDGREIRLKNGDTLTAQDIKFLYVERFGGDAPKRGKKLEIARTPHDEE
ncbi:hypothetical protein [Halobacteriovorax sp. Y22]|nr:hypothetical protein [Halobacteriovorax sp. Y22]AYF44917.1 hypothetical protein BALOs_1918 [Halobacteriovorax sp. BALOs_7]